MDVKEGQIWLGPGEEPFVVKQVKTQTVTLGDPKGYMEMSFPREKLLTKFKLSPVQVRLVGE